MNKISDKEGMFTNFIMLTIRQLKTYFNKMLYLINENKFYNSNIYTVYKFYIILYNM